MSPYKTQHEIHCAHCQGPGAARDCPDCRRPVCAGCRGAPGGCPEGKIEVHRLGRGCRVLAINPAATWALIARWGGRGRPKLVRLTGAAPVPDRFAAPISRLDALRRRYAMGFTETSVLHSIDEARARATALCSCGLHVVSIYSDETVGVGELGGARGARRETVRGHSLTAAAYDCARKRLTVGVRGLVCEFTCNDDHQVVRRESSIKLGGAESPIALASRDGVVAILSHQRDASLSGVAGITGNVSTSDAHQLRLFRAHDGGLPSMPGLEWTSGATPIAVARSRGAGQSSRIFAASGPYEVASPPLLALGDGGDAALALASHRVLVTNAETGAMDVLLDHRAPLSFIAFVDGRLATADRRGVLKLRDRVGDGYAGSS